MGGDGVAEKASKKRHGRGVVDARILLQRSRSLDVGEEEGDGSCRQAAHGASVCRGSTSGISARTEVPPPEGLSTESVPSRTATRSTSPRRPDPPTGSAPPTPSSETVTTSTPSCGWTHTRADGGARVLRDVRQRLRDDVVGGGLDVRDEPLVGCDQLDGHRRACRERLERGPEAAVRENGRVDSSRELAKLLERLSELCLRAGEQLERGFAVALQPRLEQAERDREGHEPLLCAVVEVPLERAARHLLGAHEPGSRGAQLLRAPLAFGDVEPGDEKERALVHAGEGRTGPRHRDASARLRQPRVVVLGRWLARGNTSDRVAYLVRLLRVDEDLPEDLAADLGRVVLERLLEGDVGAALCHDALVVDQAEEARGVVGDRVEECSLALLLVLEPQPLGDVHSRDEDEPLQSVAHIRHRDRRPGERARRPVRGSQLRLHGLGRRAGGGGGDRVRCASVVVLDHEIEEPSPDELVVGPADHLLEGAVGADRRVVDVAVADRAIPCERDHDARHRVEHRRLHVSLAFELALALPAHGDVESAGDDRGDDAGLVVVRRRPPVDDTVLASCVRERVLVLPDREVGSQRCEALLDGRPLPGVDEDVPVQQADHLVLVLAAGDLECGGVDVLDPAVRADDREQARNRVRHGVEELDLRAQLDLEPVASERQSRSGGHRVEQLGLVVERRVVGDRGDPPAVLLDDLHRTTGTRLRLRCGVTQRIDPAASRVLPDADRASRGQ